MPMVCHGREADHPKGPSGSKVFKAMKKSGWFTHTLGRREEEGPAQGHGVDVCVKRVRYEGSAWSKEEWHEPWVYAYWGITPEAGGLGEADLPASGSGSRPATGR